MPVHMRPADPADAPGLIAAYEWLFAAPGAIPPGWDPDAGAARLAELIRSDDVAVLVAADADRIVGFCTAYLDIRSVRFGDRAWVEDLAVHPDQRSRGIGRLLLDAAKVWARDRGATHLELDSSTTRTDAHRFYERESPDWRSLCFAWRL